MLKHCSQTNQSRQPDHTSFQSPVTNQAGLLSLDVVAFQNMTQP